MLKANLIIWNLISWYLIPTQVFAGEIWGYPISPVQAKFYSIILSVIAISILMVAFVYALFWLLDLKRKAKESLAGKVLKTDLVALKDKLALVK